MFPSRSRPHRRILGRPVAGLDETPLPLGPIDGHFLVGLLDSLTQSVDVVLRSWMACAMRLIRSPVCLLISSCAPDSARNVSIIGTYFALRSAAS